MHHVELLLEIIRVQCLIQKNFVRRVLFLQRVRYHTDLRASWTFVPFNGFRKFFVGLC